MFPEAEDVRTREAVARLSAEGIVRPVLLGADQLASSPHRDACRAAILDAIRGTRHEPGQAEDRREIGSDSLQRNQI